MPSKKQIAKDTVQIQSSQFPLAFSLDKVTSGGASLFHEEVELKYIVSGNLTMLFDNKSISAQAGDIIFINPYEIHSNVVIQDDAAIYHIAVISLDFFSGNNSLDLRQLFLTQGYRVENLIQHPEAAVIAKSLFEELREQGQHYKSAVSALLQQLFVVLLRNYAEKSRCIHTGQQLGLYPKIAPAVLKIREEYATPFSIDALADLCNMSRFYFCRVFKQAMGTTPGQYQTDYRLKIADILLCRPEWSISQIARAIGFEDAAYFSRCYKKSRGISPQKSRAILSK